MDTSLRNIDDIRNDEGAYQCMEKSMILDTAKAHTPIMPPTKVVAYEKSAMLRSAIVAHTNIYLYIHVCICQYLRKIRGKIR